MNKRINHIDIAKGISILLVVIYHSKLESVFPGILRPMGLFRMPVFFFMSGVFFVPAMPFASLARRKFLCLLKPYYVLIFACAIGFSIRTPSWFGHQVAAILYGNGSQIIGGDPSGFWDLLTPAWFLTHLFAVFLYSWLLVRLSVKLNLSQRSQIACLIGQLLIGGFLVGLVHNIHVHIFGIPVKLPGLPFSLDLIPITSSFFLLGYVLRERVKNFKAQPMITAVCLAVLVSVIVFSTARIDLFMREFNLPILAMIAAFAGIYLVTALSRMIDLCSIPKSFILLCGRSSLFILIFHIYTYTRASLYMEALGFGPTEPANVLVSLVLAVAIPIAIRTVVVSSNLLSWLVLSKDCVKEDPTTRSRPASAVPTLSHLQ